MLKSYLKTAVRNLWRNKAFSIINIVGLGVGLAACMLIFLYAKDELSFDRFHKNRDQLYHITADFIKADGSIQRLTSTGDVPGPNFKRQIPEIKDFVRIQQNSFTIRSGSEVFDQEAFDVDSTFFQLFSFPLLEGNPATALKEPNSIVLSKDVAIKFFGNADALGQVLNLKINDTFQPFVVRGIMKKFPINSSIQAEVLVPKNFFGSGKIDDSWLNFFENTFVILTPGSNPVAVERKMANVYNEDAAGQIKDMADKYGFKDKVVYHLQPLLKMHMSTDYAPDNGLKGASKPMYSYILTAIALFILLIACINFINLTVARSLKRAREVGIRKVVGGQRKQLMIQFLGESFILEFVAFMLAIGLVKAILPFFNEVSGKALSFSYLFDAPLILGYIVIFLLTGVLAGFYPAFVLSGFNPVQSLYGRARLGGRNFLAKGLVVLQFTLATFLIIAALIVYAQFSYLTHFDLGYNDKNVAVINAGFGDKSKLNVLETELLANPGVQGLTKDQGGRWSTIAHINGDQQFQFDIRHVDENYLSLFHVPVVRGRNFSKEMVSDSAEHVLVNETFVKEAGWKNPIGQVVDFFYNNKKYTVIGVVKDFHWVALNEKLPSLLLSMNPQYPYNSLYIKLRGGESAGVLNYIQKTFTSLFPTVPYSYTFREDDNRAQYDSERKWKQIVTAGALITIFISCIGLFGLATLSAEKRRKEIGIRKVLGASVQGIVVRLSSDFVRLVLIAALIACPGAWWATHAWLKNYPYHVAVNAWVFVYSVMVVLLVALFTISFQSIRAAIANPVKSLRVE